MTVRTTHTRTWERTDDVSDLGPMILVAGRARLPASGETRQVRPRREAWPFDAFNLLEALAIAITPTISPRQAYNTREAKPFHYPASLKPLRSTICTSSTRSRDGHPLGRQTGTCAPLSASRPSWSRGDHSARGPLVRDFSVPPPFSPPAHRSSLSVVASPPCLECAPRSWKAQRLCEPMRL